MIREYISLISSHVGLTNLVIDLFQKLFWEPDFPRIEALLKVIIVFPIMFDNYYNEVLKELVNLEGSSTCS